MLTDPASPAKHTDNGVLGSAPVIYATQQLGDPYEMGATGPNKWDCSGLVQWAYRQAGLDLPRTTFEMVSKNWPIVPWDKRQPGDLVFSHWGSNGPNSHVSMVYGDGQLIQAGTGGVKIFTPGDGYTGHVDSVRRVPGVSGSDASYLVPGADTLGKLASSAGAAVSNAASGLLSNPLDPLYTIGEGIGNMAASAAQVGNAADLFTKLFLPTNVLRAACGIGGVISILVGIWFLGMELKSQGE